MADRRGDGGRLRYEVLGPLRVVDVDTHERANSYIGAKKVEVLLAVLLARANQLVTGGQLTTELWGEHPPRQAGAALHVHVSQLRKFLDRAGRPASPVVTRPAGYLLWLGTDGTDVEDFRRTLDRGRSFARRGHDRAAVEELERALGLWRGAPLGGLHESAIVRAYAEHLETTRLACIDLLVHAYLRLGRHREIIGRLYALTVEFPLHEAMYRHLMLALYRSDRRVDALRVYDDASARLRLELRLEPGLPLRDLRRAIIAGDDRLYEPAVRTAPVTTG